MSALTLAYLHHSLQQSLSSIEQKQAIEQIKQVGRHIDSELSELNQATYDWGNWDDTYDYLSHPTSNFTDRHISPLALKGIGVKFLALLDPNNNTVFSEAVNLMTAEAESTASFERTLLNVKKRLQEPAAGNQKACGLDISTVGPVLICWQPVHKTNSSGDAAGTLVFGRLLNSELVNKIQNQSDVKFDLTPLTTREKLPAIQIKSHIEPDEVISDKNDPDSIHAILHNIVGEPVLNLHLNIAHDSIGSATKIGQSELIRIAAIMFVTGLLLFASVNAMMLQRLHKMGAELKSIWRNARWAERLFIYRTVDELNEIAHTVNRMLGLIRRQSISLEDIAHTDSLTQLANQRCFEQRSVIEMSLHKRNQTALSMILFDIDYFKLYNDLYGHPAGDEVLIELAKLLDEIACRPSDLTARLDEEQFAVILPATDLHGATHVADTFVRRLAERKIPHGNSPVSDVLTVSVGVTAAGDEDLASLMDRLEQAHNQARQSGRNQIVVLPFDSQYKQ